MIGHGYCVLDKTCQVCRLNGLSSHLYNDDYDDPTNGLDLCELLIYNLTTEYDYDYEGNKMVIVHLETVHKGVSLLRAGRLVAERDYMLAQEMVKAAGNARGLAAWRLMVAHGIERGQSRRRAMQMASAARRIAAFERPWWIEGGHVMAVSLLCDGHKYMLV